MAESHPNLTDLMRSPARLVPVTRALLLTNVAVFTLMLLAGAGFWHTPNGVQLAWGANFGPATQDGQWWRLATALFIHFGVVHLALNMWALWDVGRLVERLYGRVRLVLLYVGSGLVGNLASLVLHGNDAVSGGASGAVFSLYGALLVFMWRERQQIAHREFRWLFGGALVFSLLILGMGFWVPGIDNAAHGGGFLAGALLGMVLTSAWTNASPNPAWPRWCAGAATAGALAVLVAYLPQPSYRFGEEVKARNAIQAFLQNDQRVSQQWSRILTTGQRKGLSFDQLAGEIDTNITTAYERSFEQLMAASPTTDAPSAHTLSALQNYASQRVLTARELSQGLRSRDAVKINNALKQAQTPTPLPAP
jgi:rhomboid protease GluP